MSQKASLNSKKWVLITGASEGIGKQLSFLFAKDSYSLLLVARNQKKLSSLAQELSSKYSSQVKIFPQDLTLPNSAQSIYNYTQKEKISVHVLVNNAGFGTHGLFHKLDLSRELELIDLNIKALVSLTHHFLPQMLKLKSAYILNISSVAAFAPGPLMASYYASKAFVLSFSQALSQELNHTSLSVTTFCPGPTTTSFFKNANMQESRLTSSLFSQSAQSVALAAYKAMFSRDRLSIPAFKNQITVFFFRFLPRKILLPLLFRFQKSK